MNSTVAWLLLITVTAVVYVLRTRQQLRHYQVHLRRLKEEVSQFESSIADGKRLDALLLSMNEVVFRLDTTGQVMSANKWAKEVFSMQGDEFPVSLRQIYRDADWHKAVQSALQLLPEHRCLPDMEVSGVVLSPRLAVLEAGYTLLMCVDVSEQRRLEKQRRTFLSNLMHDLKTPLTSLLGYARSLDRFGEDADFRKEAASVIADEAKHVNRLLDALLTLDQIELSVRDKSLSCQWLNVLKRVCDMLDPVCIERHVTLNCELAQSSLELAIADDELDRILTNLLVNAVTYSPLNSQVKVSVSVADSLCVIVIEDSGEGIPQADLSRVTERFYQVDKARTRKDGGHGLGLAIVKELAEKNEGSLELSNRKDGGLLVKVTLSIGVE